MWSQVWRHFPRLECIGGDPFHLVIRASSCVGGSMAPTVVQQLRRVQLKWTALGSSPWTRAAYFSAVQSSPEPLNQREASRAQPGSLTTVGAKRILNDLVETTPFKSRFEFISCIAAIKCLLSADELRRRSADNKLTLGAILDKAVDPTCVEYWHNGCRWRNANRIGQYSMAPGTTGNEGAHFDLKGWVWNVRSMTKARAHTLLTLWLFSQIGRHVAEHHASHCGETRRTHFLTSMVLKIQHPAVASATRDALTSRHGLGRQAVRPRSAMSTWSATVRKRPAAALKKPSAATAKRPSASNRRVKLVHAKEKMTWKTRVVVRRKPSSYLTDALSVLPN